MSTFFWELHGIFKHFLSPKGNVGKRRDPRKLPQRGHTGLHSFLSQLSEVPLSHFAVTQRSRWSLNSWIESKTRMKNGRSWGEKEQVNIGREQLQSKPQYDIPIYLATGPIITIMSFILPITCHISWVFEW